MSIDDSNTHALLAERDEEIRKIHKRIVRDSGINKKYLTRDFIVEQVQKCPAPRFYLEPKRAMEYVNSYYKGKTCHLRPLRRAMVLDLVEAFEEVRSEHLNDPMGDIWTMVVEHPAKSFYLSPARIIEIIYQYHDRK